MLRKMILVLAVSLLSACVSFLPTFDESLHKELEAAIADINKVGAATALTPQPPFERVEPFYVSALGHLRGAEATATGITRNYRGSPASGSSQLLSGAIAECRSALERMLVRHRQGNFTRDFFDRSNLVGGTCAIPTMMSSRLRR